MRRLKNLSLRATVVLFVVGAMSCLVLLILTSVVCVTRRECQVSVERDFRATDAFLKLMLQERANGMLSVSESHAATTSMVGQLLKPPPPKESPEDQTQREASVADWATVSDIAQAVKSQTRVDDVVITNAGGVALGATSGGTNAGRRAWATLPCVEAAVEGHSWAGIVSVDGRLCVAASAPIRSQGALGDLVVRGTLTLLSYVGQSVTRDIGQALNCRIAFVSEGKLIRGPGGVVDLPALPSLTGADIEMLPHPIVSSGGRYLASFHHFTLDERYRGNTPIGVLILHPYEEATALQRSLQAGLILPFALSIALALAGGLAISRGIAQPLDGVVAAARELREGRWPRRFDTDRGDEIGLLQTVFNEMSVSLRLAQDGNLATIQALAAAVDAKDTYTQGHSRRVAELALRLARHLGLPSDEAELIFNMGTLHDVGKIGVPDGLLQKMGELDDAERKLMETHPVLGEIIVGKAPQLARTLPGIRSHHERWDGKGYPDGVGGIDIPIGARILALADTFDAMTSDRPYRRGMEKDVALAEIARGAGAQFDPEFAREFVRMMERGG